MIAQVTLALLYSLLAPPPPAPVPDPAVLARALAELPTRPSVTEVQEAALRRATLSPKTARNWLRRARAAAILPGITGEYGLRSDQGWQLDQAVGDGDELSQDLGAGRVIQLRASWDLDRLIFNPDELRAARASLDLAELRERLLVRVTQLYFERQQLLLEIASLPARDGHEAIGRHVRLAEVEAVLTGLTGLRLPRAAPARPPP
ncbi:MAG: hypothetical protein IPO88_28340 [Nannocystis sp.]|uniref:hypothetical protein n=1 Tax=Nannocystis sp. TaxID=1962667 RepID=UPI0024284DE3|nr:hypothetical protein [Nannocystis sp.]MBK9757340.1 hypothetical protein [Nannocystis sp.]